MRPASSMPVKVKSRMARSDPSTMSWWVRSPSASAINRIAAPIAPGPAISGVAIGNTEISCFDSASCSSSSVVEVPPVVRANTISMAISSSNIPPAVRSAASEIPSPPSTSSPTSANSTRIIVAIRVPRMAMERRCWRVEFTVSAAKIAATSSGPMVAKKVARDSAAVSITADCPDTPRTCRARRHCPAQSADRQRCRGVDVQDFASFAWRHRFPGGRGGDYPSRRGPAP